MNTLLVVRVIALACVGILAGIFLGYRAGPYHALQQLSASSFVQFQRVVHVHYVRFMPPLVLAALLAALAWLLLLPSRWMSAEFWLIAASTGGIALIAAATRAVNVPLNNKLMTWDVAAPPDNIRAIWAPWDRVNTLRVFVSIGVLLLEALALSLSASGTAI